MRAAVLVCQSGLAEFEVFGQRGTTGKLDSFQAVKLLFILLYKGGFATAG